jgi:hypothetical protein
MGRPVKACNPEFGGHGVAAQPTVEGGEGDAEHPNEPPSGFNDTDVGVVSDNAKQLKFKSEFDRFSD